MESLYFHAMQYKIEYRVHDDESNDRKTLKTFHFYAKLMSNSQLSRFSLEWVSSYELHFTVLWYKIMILHSYVMCLETPESCISRSHNNKDV